MRAIGVTLLSTLALAGCQPDRPARPEAPPSAPAIAQPENDFPFCGGELKPGAARAFFERLELALQSGEPVPMSFYDEAIVIESGGRHLTFRRDDFRPGAEALLSNAQWREIADRGFRDLGSVGWRGCTLGDGKAGFQGDKDGQLVLSSFDKDRAWSSLRP
jgi:hypothetical protein